MRLDGEPTFDEPWQARVMALASEMVRNDEMISRARWSEALGQSLQDCPESIEEHEMDSYYASALEVLEQLLVESGILGKQEILQRTESWQTAYERTPHGSPVTLFS